MALKSRIRLRRRQPEFRSRTVVILYSKGEPALRIDLPTVIEEDADGKFPMVQAHDRTYDPMEIDGISVSMRHRQIDE
jgi:uncharacterized radical SAM superfamily Fe-S cluster-containing enzyme